MEREYNRLIPTPVFQTLDLWLLQTQNDTLLNNTDFYRNKMLKYVFSAFFAISLIAITVAVSNNNFAYNQTNNFNTQNVTATNTVIQQYVVNDQKRSLTTADLEKIEKECREHVQIECGKDNSCIQTPQRRKKLKESCVEKRKSSMLQQ